MADLDIVDDNDNVIGKEDFIKVHSQGLRHRSVQILLFKEPSLETLLVAQRSSQQETSKLKLHPSVGGHVKLGQSYLEAAREELREELFYGLSELPTGIELVEVSRYKNDSRETNQENTCLFYTVYSGVLIPDPAEIKVIQWQNIYEVKEFMAKNPKNYTKTFLNAMNALITNPQYIKAYSRGKSTMGRQ